jgi:hypothetical protein
MAEQNIACNRPTAMGGAHVLYTYPVARAPRLQGKLVVQARSKKKISRTEKGGGEKCCIHDLPLVPNPTTCPPYPIALHGPQQAAIGRRRATGCTIRARPV